MTRESNEQLDCLDHIAISVNNIGEAVKWYTNQFKCKIEYQDETWAFLKFDNIKVALVVPNQHPPHIAFVREDANRYGELKTHRDGTRSLYIKDPAGNSVEVLAKE